MDPTAEDVLLEIGSGHGVLTKYIFNKVQHFLAFEIDKRVIEELREKYASPIADFFLQDFLEADLLSIRKKYSSSLRIVGNIPYNITSPILFKLFDEEENTIHDATIMMQHDVAKRLIAQPKTKEYGILSVFTQHYCNVKLLFTVSPSCFYPKPNVTSAVVQLQFNLD